MKPNALVLSLVLSVVVVIGIWLVCAERIPPDTLTRSRMMWAEAWIREHAAVNGSLPDSLSVLPKPRGVQEDSPVDGWGRPIQFSVLGQTVTLWSLGEDGQPGGDGQDADITVTFTAEIPEPSNNRLGEQE